MKLTYLGEGTVVPEVTLVGEAVTDETELALLDILLNGVQELLLGDLNIQAESANAPQRKTATVKCLANPDCVPPAWRWSSGESQQPC
jgi:hypothetical protein